MSYAVIPMTDYKAICDKVRDKIGCIALNFENTDFGYIRSTPFTLEKGKTYTVNVNHTYDGFISEIWITNADWEALDSPWIYAPEFPHTFTSTRDGTVRVFISYMSSDDVISASVECNEKIVSGEMADKVNEVYEQGRKEGYEQGHKEGYEQGATAFGLKEYAVGEQITFNNVHPIEHIVKANMTSKNLFEKTNQNIKIDPTKSYYLSSGETTSTNKRIKMRLIDVDGNVLDKNSGISCYGFYWSGKDVFYLASDFTSLKMVLNFKGDNRNQIAYVYFYDNPYANVQFEQSSKATPYTPYIADFSNIKLIVNETDIYSADENGIVEDIRSVSPTMSISADTEGVVINAECFLDTTAVVDELKTAILNLGGTI